MSMSIELNKGEYYPGEEIQAIINLNLEKPVKARGIFATLLCAQKQKRKYTRHIPLAEIEEKKRLGLYTEVPFTYEERIEERTAFHEEKQVSGEAFYQKGEYSVKFRLPADALPTSRVFGHDDKITVWTLGAKLDVPFALDINAQTEIQVAGL